MGNETQMALTCTEEDLGKNADNVCDCKHAFYFPVFDKYMTISGFQIEETIDRETSGDLEKLLLAVGNYSLNKSRTGLLFFTPKPS